MARTGKRGRGGLTFRFDLLVNTDTHGQYDAVLENDRKFIRFELAFPGAVVPVSVDREDRTKIAIDWSAPPARATKRARVAAATRTSRRTVRRASRH